MSVEPQERFFKMSSVSFLLLIKKKNFAKGLSENSSNVQIIRNVSKQKLSKRIFLQDEWHTQHIPLHSEQQNSLLVVSLDKWMAA